MSLKINVIYKGILYRVKGIKVLCSVVLAVIMLLAAIVGMGVWMLINVYDGPEWTQKSSGDIKNNFTEITKENINIHPPSIDFSNSEDVISTDIFIHEVRNNKFIEDNDTEKRDYFNNYIKNKDFNLNENIKLDVDINKRERTGPKRHHPIPVKIREEGFSVLKPVEVKKHNIPFERRPIKTRRLSNEETNRNSNLNRDALAVSQKNPAKEIKDRKIDHRKLFVGPKSIKLEPEKDIGDLETLSWIPILNPANLVRRTGVPSPRVPGATNELKYVGPPVVGYGENPYEKLTRDRIHEYDSFWRSYAGSKIKSDQILLEMQQKTTMKMRPHLRGLRPTGVQYDLPVRPDAQEPTRVKASRIPPTLTNSNYPLVSSNHNMANSNRPLPLVQSTNYTSINRRLQVEPDKTANKLETNQPAVTFSNSFNPLQGMYDYSKKLAASLLSFNTKSPSEIRDSSQKLAEYGINLIETHNHVFKQPTGGPLNRIASLIPTAEKLRSLDPLELSLVTWTFLDFWEFLIEKIGTLSNEDLDLLQKRLERLRKRKDAAMTNVFVNETLTRYSPTRERSLNKKSPQKQLLTSMSSDKSQNHSKEKQQQHENKKSPVSTISKASLEKFDDDHKIKHSTEETKQEESIHNKTSSVTSLENSNLEHNPQKATVNTKANKFPELSHQDEILVSLFKKVPAPRLNTKIETITNATENPEEDDIDLQPSIERLITLLKSSEREIELSQSSRPTVEGRSMWDPLGLFSSEARMKFMKFAVKVLFNFGKVYLKKPYALDCSMLLFCKDLNRSTKKGGMEAMAAKLKSVGLKVLTESDQQLREIDTFNEIWRSVTSWQPLQCDVLFPRCDGPRALEIVNEVAMGTNISS